jgi:hypothetical protein
VPKHPAGPSIDAVRPPASATTILPARAFVPAQVENSTADDDAIDADVRTLEDWLTTFPYFLGMFENVAGRWTFSGAIKKPVYATAYSAVAEHPSFNQMIDRLKAAAVSPAGGQA